MPFNATAMLKVKGASITGEIVGKREVETQYGKATIHSMKVKDANCDFTKDKQPYEPETGETVEFFGTAKLNEKLADYDAGDVVIISYLGKEKPKYKKRPHQWKVKGAK